MSLQEFIPFVPCALGVTLIIFSLFKKSTAEKLKGKGIYAHGIVFEKSYKSTNDNDAPDKITVRFTTQKNELITTEAKNEFGIYYTGQYEIGENIKILYDPDYPYDCTIITKQSDLTARVVLICVGFVLCFISLYLLLKK